VQPRDAVPLTDGRRLRYLLTIVLRDRRKEMSIEELVEVAAAHGLQVQGRPSKIVSDALRWEVRKGRIVRLRRGLYGPGAMPRSTDWWIRACLEEHERAVAATLADRQAS
jgi:hypothetical protein